MLSVRLVDCECLTVTLNSEISSSLHVESDYNYLRHSVNLVVDLDAMLQRLAKGMYVVAVGDAEYFVHRLADNCYKMCQTI